MDEDLARLGTLIDSLGCRTKALQEIARLQQQIIDLHYDLRNERSEAQKWREYSKTLQSIVDAVGYAKPFQDFYGTIKSIRKMGGDRVIVVREGKKKNRYIIGDNRFLWIREGQQIRIQNDVASITKSLKHQEDGFIQGARVTKIELIEN